MKSALWGSLLLCSAAFAQTTPGNAAADSLKKRLEDLKIFNNAPKPVVVPRQVLLQGVPAKICSIPLVNAVPAHPVAGANAGSPADADKMAVIKPGFAGQTKDFAVLPAPPCKQ